MNLLSYLVPALRDVRAPLIGGYLWLLLAWLWFSHLVPTQADLEPGSVIAALVRLQDVIGPAGLVVAVSVGAYLVGSLVSEVVDVMLRFLSVGAVPERLQPLVAAMPEVQHATDTAMRLHAEAELRLHVALPLVAISVTVVRSGDLVAALILALFAAALWAQGGVLVWRYFRIARGVERAVKDRQAEMSELERRQQRADVVVSSSSKDRLAIQNEGPETAHAVDIALPDGSRPAFLLGDLLPVREMRPGHTVELPVALSMSDPRVIDVIVSWVDPSGRQESVQTVRWS